MVDPHDVAAAAGRHVFVALQMVAGGKVEPRTDPPDPSAFDDRLAVAIPLGLQLSSLVIGICHAYYSI